MRTLIDALPYLAGGVALVALVALFVSDRPGANEHDLSDYREPDPDRLRLHHLKLAEYEALDRMDADDEGACDVCHGDPTVCGHLQDDDEWPDVDDILPPAPPGTDAGGSPLFGAVAVDMAVPTLTAAEVRRVADEWLREIAAEAQMAGVR